MAAATDAWQSSTSGIVGPSKKINIAKGGQFAIGPRLNNIDYNTPLVLSPVVPIIIRQPTWFDYITGMADLMKTLIEKNTKDINGIDSQLELGTAEAWVQADGQSVHMPTKTIRNAINPTFTLPEVQGSYVWYGFNNWIEMINSPDTHFSAIASMLESSSNASAIDPMLYSSFTMDIMLISFDQTMLPENIVKGVILSTVFPKTAGAFGLKRQWGQVDNPSERTIDFFAILQDNAAVHQACIDVASVLKLHQVDYRYATPVGSQIDGTTSTSGSSIMDTASTGGIQDEITDIVSQFTSTTTT